VRAVDVSPPDHLNHSENRWQVRYAVDWASRSAYVVGFGQGTMAGIVFVTVHVIAGGSTFVPLPTILAGLRHGVLQRPTDGEQRDQ
jgi:hypothetical protein